MLTPPDRGLLCLFSGVGAYLGEGVPWGILRLQLESHPEPGSSDRLLPAVLWGLVCSPGRDFSAKAHGPLEGRSWV